MKRCPHFLKVLSPIAIVQCNDGKQRNFCASRTALHWCDTLCDFSFLLGVILLGELCVTGTTSLIHRSPVSQKPNNGEISQRYPKNIPSVSVTEPFPWPQDTHVPIVNGYIATGLKCH